MVFIDMYANNLISHWRTQHFCGMQVTYTAFAVSLAEWFSYIHHARSSIGSKGIKLVAIVSASHVCSQALKVVGWLYEA